ncbi:MAG TPA: helicase C-terminal domain-containing protein, partial [Thermoanaerobaculia bacterium]|nr:helicase C-terminal domain-containing protein [Thermoanaerobaculia bacterium]
VGRGESVETTLPEDDLWALRPELDEAFVDYLEYQRESKSFRAEDPFVTFYFDFLRFLNGLVASQSGAFSQIAERRGRSSVVRILCKDPSPFLGATLARVHSAIALSATLSPSEFYRDLLGFDPERTAALSVPNPFPAANRRVVVDARVATSWRKRPENYPVIAERLSSFAESVPGNCLALFPSYDFLRSVAELLEPKSKRILIQDRADSDRERQAILEALRGAVLRDILLLAVAGGVFAEGVDYPGDTLKAVAVIGPCLPGVSLDRELLKQYYQERFERGFEYAFVVPGMTRVVQAAGRLIRSAQDTGVIALFGERFLVNPYRRNLPREWLPEEGATALASEPAASAEAFFSTLLSP